ncbi:unnamed protein product [Calypogeia fissa]
MVVIFGDHVPKWKCKPQLSPRLGGGLNDTVTSVVMEPVCMAVSSLCDLDPGTWQWVGKHITSTVSEWGPSVLRSTGLDWLLRCSLLACSVVGTYGAGIYGSLWVGRERWPFCA